MELNTGWILQFLQNVCLFAAIVLCYREIIRAALAGRQRTLLLGVLFGAAAIVGVLLPVVLLTGHDFDIEVLPIGLAACLAAPSQRWSPPRSPMRSSFLCAAGKTSCMSWNRASAA
jgi:hypothetical protein